MPDEETKPASAPSEDQATQPVDLQAFTVQELEQRRRDLRRQLAENQASLIRSTGWGGSGRIAAMAEASANRLVAEQSAIRDDLEGVENEIRARRETDQMERERRILDSTRWATWAAALAALVSAVATAAMVWKG